MKHYLLLLICCVLSTALRAQSETHHPLHERQLRDSIFRIYHSMPADGAGRIEFMRSMLQKNIGKRWSAELLDSALVLTADSNLHEEEIAIRYDYYRHYKYMADTARMSKAFRKLETASRKYNQYDLYFAAWGDILQFSTVRGDTEYVLLQANRMGEEARKLDNVAGIYNSLLTTARALRASKQEEGAIKKYREALEIPSLPKVDRATVYNEISTIHLLRDDYDKTLAELNMQREMMEQAIKEAPDKADSYSDKLLDMELSYCAVYLDLPDLSSMHIHLQQARKYFSPNTLFSYKIKYHLMRGGYYCLKGEWDKSFSEYDTALASFDDTQPLFKMTVRMIKGNALERAGRHHEAADNYRLGVMEMDSLNNDVLRLHEEAHRANYIIRQALLDKATAERRYNLTLTALVIVLVASLAALMARALYVRRRQLASEQKIRQALETVESANKMKEVFLRNITSQIREPLNLVVGFAELLSTEKGLTEEQVQEYAMLMKKSAGCLSQLIFNVLDLSRLESGMMKFAIEECDAVQLCREARMMVQMNVPHAVHLDFRMEPEQETLPISTDSRRFTMMLTSLLSVPTGYSGLAVVEYVLSTSPDSPDLTITVQGSPLLEEIASGNASREIQHSINSLFLQAFGGTYRLVENGSRHLIVITYPLLNSPC